MAMLKCLKIQIPLIFLLSDIHTRATLYLSGGYSHVHPLQRLSTILEPGNNRTIHCEILLKATDLNFTYSPYCFQVSYLIANLSASLCSFGSGRCGLALRCRDVPGKPLQRNGNPVEQVDEALLDSLLEMDHTVNSGRPTDDGMVKSELSDIFL